MTSEQPTGVPMGTPGVFSTLTRHWGAGEASAAAFERQNVTPSDTPEGVAVSFVPDASQPTQAMWLDATTVTSASTRRMSGLPVPFPEVEQNQALDVARELDLLTGEMAGQVPYGQGLHQGESVLSARLPENFSADVAGATNELLALLPEIDSLMEASAACRREGRPLPAGPRRDALRSSLANVATEVANLSSRLRAFRDLSLPDRDQSAAAPADPGQGPDRPARRVLISPSSAHSRSVEPPARQVQAPGFDITVGSPSN